MVNFDFGNEPILFGWVTRNPGFVGVLGVAGVFVCLPFGGWLGGIAVAIAAVNDFAYAIRNPDEPLNLLGDAESPTPAIQEHTEPLDNLFGEPKPAVTQTQLDLVQHLVGKPMDQMKSMIVLGESGSGKGIFVERWKDAVLERFPNAVMYAVNGKPDKRESSRWKGFRQVLDIRSEDDAHKALTALEKIATALEQRLDEPSDIPFVLAIDELNTILDFWSKEQTARATALMKRIARQGRSLRCWLLLTLQSPNADELGMSASDRTNFVLVALGYQHFQGVLRLAASNNSLFPGLPAQTIKTIAAHKGQDYGIALCSDLDDLVLLPPVDQRAKLEDLFKQNISEPQHKPAIDLDKLIDLVEILTPHEGDILKVRDFYRNSEAKKLGVHPENAENLMRDIANETRYFRFESESFNTGKTSKFLRRI